MATQTIHQKKAVELLKSGQSVSDYDIHFNDDKVEALDAFLLRKNGIALPEHLVFYDDDSIDFEDDADIKAEDLENKKLLQMPCIEDMYYFLQIKSFLKDHIELIKSISTDNESENSRRKIKTHLDSTVNVNETVDEEEPQKLRKIIEYLHTESRFFGWSFPENDKEERCENSFWELKQKIEKLVRGMTGNERLYYFGYLEDWDNLLPHQKSARDEIRIKLFMYR